MTKELFHEGESVVGTNLNKLSWHDCGIHGVFFLAGNKISIDIDYIQKWMAPSEEETYYKFLLSPASLVFEDVFLFKSNVEFRNTDLSIDEIKFKDAAHGFCRYIIQCHQGTFEVVAKNAFLLIRSEPICSDTQRLPDFSRAKVT